MLREAELTDTFRHSSKRFGNRHGQKTRWPPDNTSNRQSTASGVQDFSLQQSMTTFTGSKYLLGWREWIALPELGVPRLKCKVDTGARTSSLHAFYVEDFVENGRRRVRFGLHPLQGRNDEVIDCVTDVIDEREVCDSGGHREMRLVIMTPITIGPWTWSTELTLTNRDSMLFRMLLGRSAINGRFLINPHASFLAGKQLLITPRPGKKKKMRKK